MTNEGERAELVRRSFVASLGPWCAYALIASLIGFSKGLLEGMHWDVPIYLYQAKRFAETHYFEDFVRDAWAIAAQVSGGWPADEGYSEAFWRSVRLGHIALLGSVVNFFGSSLLAISVASWFFVLLLFAGVYLWVKVAEQLGRAVEPTLDLSLGLAISVFILLVSDIYTYLTGNLVSEVPSLTLAAIAVVMLLRALQYNSVAFSVLSGILIFLSFTIKVESVWTWLSLIAAYVLRFSRDHDRRSKLQFFLIAGIAAFAAYAVYAFLLYPLPDPRLYIAFAASLTERAGVGVPAWQLLWVAGGGLWIGAMLALRWIKVSPLIQLGCLWLALSCLPSLSLVALNSATQSRMLVACNAPLLLLSGAGWTMLCRSRGRALLQFGFWAILTYLVLSRAAVFNWLVQQPGVWRLQELRGAFLVPNYERVNYFPKEMERISLALYREKVRTTLIPGPEIPQEVLNMIRFFGPRYPADASLALVSDPTNLVPCEAKLENQLEPVRFCKGFADERALRAAVSSQRLLHLRGVSSAAPAGSRELIRTEHFVLDEWSAGELREN